jgi:Beta-lactamase
MRPICFGFVKSQVMLRPQRAIVVMITIATVLFSAWNASADQRDVALDAAIPAAMRKASAPGAIVGIWQDGRAPYVRTFGVRSVATREPMAPDLYMRIGSTSKSFTTTAVLLLADQGGWASGNMISTLEDMRAWARDFALGKLLSPAMKRERDRFLPAPQEGDGALYGLAIENQNGWFGHNGNIMSYMAYPYYLPSEGITMVVLLNSGVDVRGSWAMMQNITTIITPNNLWPGLPKQ